VISGDPDAVAKAGAACKERGAKRVVPLKVSGAFHSSLMAPAANHLRVALEHAPFRDPRSGDRQRHGRARARREGGPPPARRPADRSRPVGQLHATRRRARRRGRPLHRIGPGNVLAGLLRRIVPGANVTSLGTADEVATFLEAA